MRAGDRVARYELLDLIGHGATGRVWRARDPESGDRVAVKVLREELADDPEVRARFVAEGELLASRALPGVVRVLEVVDRGERPALVAELVDGPDLRRLLSEQGPMPPAEVCAFGAQVATALSAAHAAGLVHRDLKPENVLVGSRRGHRVALVTDFGIARVVDAPTVTRASRIVGTADYLAPEVVEGARAGAPADVYALGVLLFELLSGWRPYRGSHPAAVMDQHRRGRLLEPAGVPSPLWAVVQDTLSRSPASRPAAADVARRLAELAGELRGLPALQRTDPPPPAPLLEPLTCPTEAITVPGRPSPRRSSRRPRRGLLTAAATAAVLAVSGTAYSQLSQPGPAGPQSTRPTAAEGTAAEASSTRTQRTAESAVPPGQADRAEEGLRPAPEGSQPEEVADELPHDSSAGDRAPAAPSPDGSGVTPPAVPPAGPATVPAPAVPGVAVAPPAPAPPPAASPPRALSDLLAYEVTSDHRRGAVPFVVRPGGAVEQTFTADLAGLRSVSTVIGRDLRVSPFAPGESDFRAGTVLFEVLDPAGAVVFASRATVVNNRDTGVAPTAPLPLRTGHPYSLRVTNLSSVLLGFYCAPSPAGRAQAVGHGLDGRPNGPLVHHSPVSLSAKIYLRG